MKIDRIIEVMKIDRIKKKKKAMPWDSEASQTR